MSITTQVSFNNKERSVAIRIEGGDHDVFNQLCIEAKKVYPGLRIKKLPLKFLWVDDDGDEIAAKSDSELREAIKCMMENNLPIVFKAAFCLESKELPIEDTSPDYHPIGPHEHGPWHGRRLGMRQRQNQFAGRMRMRSASPPMGPYHREHGPCHRRGLGIGHEQHFGKCIRPSEALHHHRFLHHHKDAPIQQEIERPIQVEVLAQRQNGDTVRRIVSVPSDPSEVSLQQLLNHTALRFPGLSHKLKKNGAPMVLLWRDPTSTKSLETAAVGTVEDARDAAVPLTCDADLQRALSAMRAYAPSGLLAARFLLQTPAAADGAYHRCPAPGRTDKPRPTAHAAWMHRRGHLQGGRMMRHCQYTSEGKLRGCQVAHQRAPLWWQMSQMAVMERQHGHRDHGKQVL